MTEKANPIRDLRISWWDDEKLALLYRLAKNATEIRREHSNVPRFLGAGGRTRYRVLVGIRGSLSFPKVGKEGSSFLRRKVREYLTQWAKETSEERVRRIVTEWDRDRKEIYEDIDALATTAWSNADEFHVRYGGLERERERLEDLRPTMALLARFTLDEPLFRLLKD